MRFIRTLNPAFLLILLLAGGCVGSSPATRFYLLEPDAAARRENSTSPGPVIAVGPVRVAKYLDRPQIVIATGRNAYQVDEFHRWAEYPDENITRVLAQNLAAMVPAERVLTDAPDREASVDFRVGVNIQEFHIDPAGEALLTAQWSLRHGNETVLANTSSFRVPASKTDYPVMVEALNKALNSLSGVIAASIREQTAKLPPHR